MDETLTPRPAGALSITACVHRVEALYQGHIIADSAQARLVKEDGEPDAYYFPRSDVEMEKLARTDHVTHSALKGDARYWSIPRDGRLSENAVWSYEAPLDAAEDLRDMIAFDPAVVEIHVVDSSSQRMSRQEDKIGDYIRHTDSGSGRSQEAPWPPNVGQPDLEAGELPDNDNRVRPR